VQEHSAELEGTSWDVDSLMDYVQKAYERLQSHITHTSVLLNNALDTSKRVLLEGAQGTLLDIDHGTYPYVTSSSPTAGGACAGAGIGPTRVNRVMGVSKAYSTRVGSGPFPTELNNETGERLRALGHEFGTTTGRARRCGWLDLVALRYAVRINGMTHLALTKMDVLDSFETLHMCVAYRIGGELTTEYPTQCSDLEHAEPVYETVQGWNQSTQHVRQWSDLPPHAMSYITRIEEYIRVPVALVSLGADRNASFSRLGVWEGL
jgi:adenylosuccinate synthase